jgi:hypothetical protein
MESNLIYQTRIGLDLHKTSISGLVFVKFFGIWSFITSKKFDFSNDLNICHNFNQGFSMF